MRTAIPAVIVLAIAATIIALLYVISDGWEIPVAVMAIFWAFVAGSPDSRRREARWVQRRRWERENPRRGR